MLQQSHKPALLALPFDAHTPQSFAEHVASLKKAPPRSSGIKRPVKLPVIKGLLQPLAKVFELSSGSLLYSLNFTTERMGRKTLKYASRTEISLASAKLLQPEGAIVAFLEKKKFLIGSPGACSS